ncbi:hypothetical protein [Leptolyngbya sp. NIES-2104]|uniref:hypothetical protein n=1 Tax=Leptolyngbya sp. NIES-2104 TaxID=1552121 RepID=UPI0006EC8AAB|nr:hypothetical protein [Leptolyngbya sp. NIES-2104]GAP96801.1 hypothetical protein NIES2104_33480 [Leptolyngbya sp. NIES-2104]
MANLKLFAGIGAALILSGCTTLNTVNTVAQTPTVKPAKDNLIGLFIVKRNNFNQQYRGEIFPIARYSNGRYTDASTDVTLEMRQNSNQAEIVKRNAAKSVLNTKPTFNLPLSQFSVDRLNVGQFACSSMLVGQGKLTGQSTLKTAFDQLPASSQSGSRGFSYGRKFDETWRSTIATQSAPTSGFKMQTNTIDPLEQFRQDLLRIGTSEIAKNSEAKSVQGSVQLIDVKVFDLDRDGQPEVFSRLRKAPTTPVKPPVDRATSIDANVWIKYGESQPTLLASQVVPYYVPKSDSFTMYDVLGTIDANGDGKQEVLIQNNGYELTNFSIYELQNDRLKSVFTGASYGC